MIILTFHAILTLVWKETHVFKAIKVTEGEKMIRRAIPEDIPAIEQLLRQVLKVHYNGRPDIFKKVGYKYTPEELYDIIADETTPVFVYVEEDGLVAGHCFCQIIDRPEQPHANPYKTLYIDDLCVNENYRKKGIGTKLYQYTLEYARANGFHNVTLHAWECNPEAVSFYKALGMKIQQYTFEEVL